MRDPLARIPIRYKLTFGFVGLENVYRAGSPVVREIIDNWETWQEGPPPLPN